ncbi:Exonuclease 1 [Dictyocoela muelleri]|nr:Exonuclease 1 [Dictyocoela muelleri]
MMIINLKLYTLKMGITGLLPILKPVLKRSKISILKGKRVGVDGHSWLHQSAPHIAVELYHQKSTTRHLNVINKKIEILLSHQITPIIVFDGDSLPSKRHTDELRRINKQKIKNEVEKLLKRKEIKRANELMKRCVYITREMVNSTIEFLREKNVECIVSPYESDAQLTYLQRIGYIDAIIAEDSDLVVYGCTNVCYKFDGEYFDYYKKGMLKKCWDTFFEENILDIAIMSGCDYLPGIEGVGIKTAYKLLKEHGTPENVVKFLSIKKNIDSNYINEFYRAKKTFQNQIVIDPHTNERKYLSLSTENSQISSLEQSLSINSTGVEYLGSLESNQENSFDSSQKNSSLSKDILTKEEFINKIGIDEFNLMRVPDNYNLFIYHEEEFCQILKKS